MSLKKCFMLVLSLAALACLAGCQPNAVNPSPSVTPDTRPLTEVMATLLADVPDLPMSIETEITDENFSAYFFIDPIEGAEGLASDAAIGTIPHSVCLLRLPEGVNAATVAAEISERADPAKWICVVAEDIALLHKGNLVLFVMSSTDSVNAISTRFNEAV